VIVEFRRTNPARELRNIIAFDHKVFRKSDWFSTEEWRSYESYWMLIDGRKIGCCAFERHPDTLDVVSSGIHPRHQGKGFGTLMKAWQIAFARHHGFAGMVTCSRKSNQAMIALNRKFGFKKVRIRRAYYVDPVESAVVMEKLL
jgi:ribosomal protein S18 acetylase RimI-like enzyme